LLLPVFSVPAGAAGNRIHGPGNTLTSTASTAAGRVRNRGRGLASVVQSENKDLFEKVKPGDYMLVQNSTYDFNDEVLQVTDLIEDGSLRLRRPNGQMVFVRARNLSTTLSPEVPCGMSHGTKICKGDRVFVPMRSASLGLPEAPVEFVFANGSVVVKDGGRFVLDLSQVGKRVRCSPEREDICVGDYVFAEAYKADARFDFDGVVENPYTNGVVVVKVGSMRYPIDVSALKKRIATLDTKEEATGPIAPAGSRAPASLEETTVTPELEPLNPMDADRVKSER
jgi:hypothetical protein